MIPNLISETTVNVSHNGKSYTYHRDQPEYLTVVDYIRENDEAGLIEFLDSTRKVVEDTYSGKFRVVDNVVFVKNEDGSEDSLPNTLGQRLILFAKEKLPYEPILKFWERLRKNPSYLTVERLFECLDVNHHAIMLDGRFCAYKRVRSDFKDFYTGKFDNSVGKVVEVPRNYVNDDPETTCAQGVHLSSYSYAKNDYHAGEGIMIECAIDPADVVVVPRDYGQKKFRCSKYEVLRVCEEEKENKSQLYDYNPDDEDDEDDDCPDCEEPWVDCVCDLDEDEDDGDDFDDEDDY